MSQASDNCFKHFHAIKSIVRDIMRKTDHKADPQLFQMDQLGDFLTKSRPNKVINQLNRNSSNRLVRSNNDSNEKWIVENRKSFEKWS